MNIFRIILTVIQGSFLILINNEVKNKMSFGIDEVPIFHIKNICNSIIKLENTLMLPQNLISGNILTTTQKVYRSYSLKL